MQKPSFWRLFGAYGVDLAILLVVNVPFLLAMTYAFDAIHGIKTNVAVMGGLLVAFIINAGYFSLLEKRGKGSWGKRIFSLKTLPASVWHIVGAYAIDWSFFFLLTWGFVVLDYRDPDPLLLDFFAVCICFPFGIILSYLYFSISEGIFGKTLGKKLMGLQVVQVTPQKQKEETK